MQICTYYVSVYAHALVTANPVTLPAELSSSGNEDFDLNSHWSEETSVWKGKGDNMAHV
jgi:hypothetical protein